MFNKYYINNLKKKQKKHIFVCIIAVRFLLYYLSIFIITALFIIDPQLIEKNLISLAIYSIAQTWLTNVTQQTGETTWETN